MSEILARWAAEPMLTLAVLVCVAGLAMGIFRRSGVPAFVGLILGSTLAFGPGVFGRWVQALSG